MQKKSNYYRNLCHTADLGILVKGRSCKQLFKNAGMALLEQLIDNVNPIFENRLDISLHGNDLSDLMVKWLSEILYLFEGEKLIVTGISINLIEQNRIHATLSAMKYNERYHEVLREIKAVTYHQIEVKEEKGLWTARVIFDL